MRLVQYKCLEPFCIDGTMFKPGEILYITTDTFRRMGSSIDLRKVFDEQSNFVSNITSSYYYDLENNKLIIDKDYIKNRIEKNKI